MSNLLSQPGYAPIITTQQALNNAAMRGSDLPNLILPDGDEGSDKFESAVDDLFTHLHRALWNRGHGHQVYDRNPLSNYSLFEGRLNPNDHDDILMANFAPGIQKVKDYSFFSANENILNGMQQQAGLKFSVISKGPKWEAQRRQQVAQQGAEESLRMMTEAANKQMGADFAPALTDESIYVPESEDEWNEAITPQQQLQSEIFERLAEANEIGNTEKQLLDCFRDKFINNTEIAHVGIRYGQPYIERLPLERVSFWGREDAETAEDMSAWAVRSALTFSEVVARWAPYLEETGDFKEIMDSISQISGTPLDTVMRRFRDGRLEELLNSERPPLPILGGDGKLFSESGVCIEQHIYVKLLRSYYFVLLVKVESDGTPCPLREMTDDEIKALNKGRYGPYEHILYQRVNKSRYDELKRSGVKSLRGMTVAELWDSVRLGDSKVIFRRMTPGQEREPGRISTPKFPIVAHFGRDASMVTKCRPFHEMYTNAMILLRKKVALSGIKAFIYDQSQLPKGYTMERVVWEAKEAGVIATNGARQNGTPTKDSYKHLSAVDLSMDSELSALLMFCVALQDAADKLCGITPAMKASYQNRETQGQTQISLAQGTMTTARHFYEHSQFTEQVLNRMVSRGKYVWVNQQIPRSRGAVLETVLGIPANYYGIYIENTIKNQQDKDFIMQLAMQGISSGSVSLGEVIKMYYSENSVEVLNIFQNGLTAMQAMQAQQQQQQAQLGQMQAEINQQKIQVPIMVAETTGKWQKEIEEMKQNGLAQRSDNDIAYKQDHSDIQNQVDVKRDLIRNAGQQELSQQNQPV